MPVNTTFVKKSDMIYHPVLGLWLYTNVQESKALHSVICVWHIASNPTNWLDVHYVEGTFSP